MTWHKASIGMSFFFAITTLALQEPGAPITLDGHWLSICHQGKISEMRINGSSSSLRESFYLTTQCQGLAFSIETLGEIHYPPTDTEVVNEIQPVDYTYKDVLLTPLTQEMADHFNQIQLCDLTSWHILTPQRITHRHCRFIEGARPIAIPNTGQKLFGVFKITEPWLYFGRNNSLEDSSAPNRRPKDLQPEPFGRRYQ